MERDAVRTKLFLSASLIAVLAVVLVLTGKKGGMPEPAEKVEGVTLYQALERFEVFLLDAVGKDWRERLNAGQDAASYEDLMTLCSLFVQEGLIDKNALVELEQRIAAWTQAALSESTPSKSGLENNALPGEAELEECYVLFAGYSLIPEKIGVFDVYLFGEPEWEAGEMAVSSMGKLKLAEKRLTGEKLMCGRSYSFVLEGETVTAVLGFAEGKVVLHNAWVITAKGGAMSVFYGGITSRLRLEQPVKQDIRETVADVVISGDYVVSMTVKRDAITAKVLRSDKKGVELEGYGMLEFEEDFKIYKIYGELSEEPTASILVGYTATAFVISGKKICAALLTGPVTAANIRVLIQSSSYGGYYHNELTITSNKNFYISGGTGSTDWRQAGESVTVTKEQVEAAGGRLYFGTVGEEGTLTVTNLKRMSGAPSYRGSLEAALIDGRLVLVNELSIEEYLYGVLPSEMPVSFGMEALKAQAVCARSYAYYQLLANGFHSYGAHVDDSVSSQVYQNYGENEAAVYAVKDTFGKILTYEGKCVPAYYFSCSCGATSDSMDVWGETVIAEHVSGKEQTRYALSYNLDREEEFAEFLHMGMQEGEGENGVFWDAASPWFRWQTKQTKEALGKVLYERLKNRFAAAPDCILVKKKNADGEEEYVSMQVPELGELLELEVLERGGSGIVKELLIVGSKASVLVKKEYNIRAVLAATDGIVLNNGTVSSPMALLPSAYVQITEAEDGWMLYGGGYGHGVGMSQYGAKGMAQQGMDYMEILSHFYGDCEITYLYR